MILVESGQEGAEAFEAKVLFAGVLAGSGLAPVIDEATLPADLSADLRYEAAPFVTDIATCAPERCIVIVGESVDTLRTTALRASAQGLTHVALVGRFETAHMRITSVARVAHAVGREPAVADLSGLQPFPWPIPVRVPLFAPKPAQSVRPDIPGLLLWLSPGHVVDPSFRTQLIALAQSKGLRLRVVVPAAEAEAGYEMTLLGVETFRDTEMDPLAFAGLADVLALEEGAIASPRAALAAVSVMQAGRPVLDLSSEALLAQSGAPVLRGPPGPAGLSDYVETTVLPNLPGIARMLATSQWVRETSVERLLEATGLSTPSVSPEGAAPAYDPPLPAKVHFIPTNGIGFGHARRCQLIAEEMAERDRIGFLAYGACSDAVAAGGWPVVPLISRSADHGAVDCADIVNSLRLSRSVSDGDIVVFDGGYVFDSVVRRLAEGRVRGVWIRRGLWMPGQATPRLMEREKVFSRVIVPGEAFRELDRPMSFGPKVTSVGPIVAGAQLDATARDAVRKRIADAAGRSFDRLVVSMLGAGVAADRSAQLHVLCHEAERRVDTLHLVLVWPGAVVAQGLYGWKASRVVQSLQGAELAAAADAVVSAAGYNSFHEILYNRVPAVLVPQTAPFMDDQGARARAAAERGLALAVPGENLLELTRAFHDLLDGKAEPLRASLAGADLPAPGNAAAARIIESEASA